MLFFLVSYFGSVIDYFAGTDGVNLCCSKLKCSLFSALNAIFLIQGRKTGLPSALVTAEPLSPNAQWQKVATVDKIYIYPGKSMKGVSVQSATVRKRNKIYSIYLH